MNLSREVLTQLEVETGFRAATLEKVLRLGAIAREVASHAYLGSRLVLKGGTAIQLGLGAPRRLSVDLDYNYIGQLGRAAMLQERPEIETALHRVARAGGYRVTESADEHAGRKLYLGYRGHTGSADRIEFDITYQMRQPIEDPVTRALWQPGHAEPVTIISVGDAELWAGKIAALLDRGMPRDLFDVAQLAGSSPHLVGEPRFRRIVIAWCGMLPHPLHTYGRDRLDRVDDASIERQLAPMLAGLARPKRDDLTKAAWQILEPILELEEREMEYCERLQRGELKPELLFGADDPIAERFREHPALKWKALNARAHHEHQGKPRRTEGG